MSLQGLSRWRPCELVRRLLATGKNGASKTSDESMNKMLESFQNLLNENTFKNADDPSLHQYPSSFPSSTSNNNMHSHNNVPKGGGSTPSTLHGNPGTASHFNVIDASRSRFNNNFPPFINAPREVHVATCPHRLRIKCAKNNIFMDVSQTLPTFKTLLFLSSGCVGAKNAAKTSPRTAIALLDTVRDRLRKMGIDTVRITFEGITQARTTLINQVRKTGLKVTEVIDTTGIPFNGNRPKKARRL